MDAEGTKKSVLGPRESSKFIANNSTEITVNKLVVREVGKLIHECVKNGMFEHADFNAHEMHIKSDNPEETINWIFLIDTINFSFWSEREDWFAVTYKDRTYTGYFAACACVNRALDNGIPITDAGFMATVDENVLRHVFRTDSSGHIPLLKDRVKVVNEAGRVLLEKFDGSFKNCVTQCGQSAQQLLRLIVDNFASYRDFATFKGCKVSFLKRAQILVSDIYSALHTSYPPAEFSDIGSLTMFADYRVPQALAYCGVLTYSPTLLDELNASNLLENGAETEVLIRGMSIYACDLIASEVEVLRLADENPSSLRRIHAVDVDMFLWVHRRNNEKQIEEAKIPFHRVRCIYY